MKSDNQIKKDSLVTVITSIVPNKVNKDFSLTGKGALTKTAVACISKGDAIVHEVNDSEAMVKLLLSITDSDNKALMLGTWKGSNAGDSISLVTQKELESKGAINQSDSKIAARIKDDMDPSSWILIDADNPVGMPVEWRAMGNQQRLEMLEDIVPGISTVERVECLSSSSRVRALEDNSESLYSHAYIQVSDSAKVEQLRLCLNVETVTKGLSFKQPMHSRKTGDVIGEINRTVIDTAVLDHGRLIFTGKPTLKGRAVDEYKVLGANPKIVNKGGGILCIDDISVPNKASLDVFKEKTQSTLNVSIKGGALSIVEKGSLTLNTDITIDGETHSLKECLQIMQLKGLKKVRCEAPFRVSSSQAAFVRITDSNEVFVYDAGTSTSYYLDDEYNPKEEGVNSFNETLDNEGKGKHLDLLRFIDDGHIIKKLSIAIADATHMPKSTVFLAGMGVFASMAARRYCVTYRDGTCIPLGLYIVLEQPSGMGKSRCLKFFQKPFQEARSVRVRELRSELLKLEKIQSDPEKELSDHQNLKMGELKNSLDALEKGLFVTNATPESLEKIMLVTNGHFSAISSEQGMFDSLFGGAYLGQGRISNNDTVLNGFDGGEVSSFRVNREGFIGEVLGAIVSFAQSGSIEKLLEAATGTGLSERFLMLDEEHLLGTRDHTVYKSVDEGLLSTYKEYCADVFQSVESVSALENLHELKLSDEGYRLIDEYRNKIEPELADGRRFSYAALRGAVSKANIHIMKLASLLHLLDSDLKRFLQGNVVADTYVEAAIHIVDSLLDNSLSICNNKGLIGKKAEFDSILGLFDKKSKRSEREIIKAKVKTNPFKHLTGNKSIAVRKALDEMVEQKILILSKEGGKSMYALGQ